VADTRYLVHGVFRPGPAPGRGAREAARRPSPV